MRKAASIAGVLMITCLISAVCPLPVQGWAGFPGIYDLHAHMTEDTLEGARSDGLLLSDQEIDWIAEKSNEVDLTEGGPHHRVTYYDNLFYVYGGEPYLGPGAEGAESWARDWIDDARVLYAAGDTSNAGLCLGYAIHYIQDAVCPPHVFPFEMLTVGGAHQSFEEITWEYYAYTNWSSLVASATPIPISSAEDLRQKIMDAADWVYQKLTCKFVAPDGGSYMVEPGLGMFSIPPFTPHDPFYVHWDMTDDDIGLAMEKAAELVKGAAIWAISEGRPGVGGPDPFGYTFLDSNTPDGPTHDWIEISSTGTEVLPSSDDSYTGLINMGFFFNHYGTDYTQIKVGNNGLLFEDAPTSQYVNQPITQTPGVHGFIAPFWDDIVTWGSAGSIYYQTLGEEPNRKFVVEWKDNQHYYSSTSGITCQAILYEGSNNILFQYQDVDFGTVSGSTSSDLPPYDNGGSATVGIEGPTGDIGLQYSFNEQVINPGLAILFKFPQFAGTNLYLSKQAPASKDHGSAMTYTLHYHNFGDTIAQNVVLEDSLSAQVEFVSASDGGIYDSGNDKVTWDIGDVVPLGHASITLQVRIPGGVPIGSIIQNNASISTSTLEVRYDDNVAQAQTRVTGSNLPPDVGVEPNNGGSTPSVYWHDPITFSYYNPTATGVDIKIHIDDGGSDITGSMTGGPLDWTYTTNFYPRYGHATVTYVIDGECPQPTETLPDGLHLPVATGLIGLEQHLYNNTPGDGYVPPAGNFPAAGLVGIPEGYTTYTLDNGYAGPGAFAPHPSNISEQYYLNMRWPDGIIWNEDGTHDFTDLVTYLKYAHKKVLIVSPVTGKRVVASIEESGPAIWTGKDAGAPPEVFVALGLYPRGDGQNDPANYTLEYYWVDQSAPLGPCVQSTIFDIYIDPAGYIYDTETGERIANAIVWLQRPDGSGGWENVPTGEAPALMQPDINPLVTGTDGQYQWDVLEGSYRVHVEASGYYPADSIVVSIPPPVTDLHVGLTRILLPLYRGMTIVPVYPGVDIDLPANLPDEAVMVWHQVTADEATPEIPAGTWLHWIRGAPPQFNSLHRLVTGKTYLISATADCVWPVPAA